MMHNRPWSAGELIAFLILLVVMICYEIELIRQRKIRVLQAVAIVLFLLFMTIVFESTVFTRKSGKRYCNLEVLWSWKRILNITGGQSWESRKAMLEADLLNILLLYPAGILLPVMMNRKITWKHSLLIGVIISSSIEVLLLVLCRGFFEFDDIIHNAIGFMLGSMCATKLLYRRLKV